MPLYGKQHLVTKSSPKGYKIIIQRQIYTFSGANGNTLIEHLVQHFDAFEVAKLGQVVLIVLE